MRATVADGAIVVGALGVGCSAAALGPCGGNEALVLSSGMGRLMAEVRAGDRAARLVPVVGPALATAAISAEERVAARAAAESTARSIGLLAAEPTASAQMNGNDRAAAELLTLATDSVAELKSAKLAALRLPSDPSGALIWGRWSISPTGQDQLMVPFSVASVGRHVTVADDAGGLFRANDPSNPGRLLPDSLNAQVDFKLSRASASYEIGGRTESAIVEDGGKLKLDFGRRTFATALAMSSASAGRAELRMVGDVRKDGTFAVKDIDQRIAGAVTLDGKEAGYLFERGASGGLFRGKTLWGR